jgi:hypothetical protein
MKKRWHCNLIGLIFSLLLPVWIFHPAFFDSLVSVFVLSLLIIVNALCRAKEQYEYEREENGMKPYVEKE